MTYSFASEPLPGTIAATFCVRNSRVGLLRAATFATNGSSKHSALPSRPPFAHAARSGCAMLDRRSALYRAAMNAAAVSLPAVPVPRPPSASLAR